MFEHVHVASVVLGLAPFARYILVSGFADGALHICHMCDFISGVGVSSVCPLHIGIGVR